MTQNWDIKQRSTSCAESGKAFQDGEDFYAAIFFNPDTGSYIRKDYSSASWQNIQEKITPFSFWRSTFEIPEAEEKKEIVEKEDAESLLRRLIKEDHEDTENTRYILAIMLERKKILKHIETHQKGTEALLIYERAKTGEAFIVKDPQLRLSEIEPIQNEVSQLLEK